MACERKNVVAVEAWNGDLLQQKLFHATLLWFYEHTHDYNALLYKAII